MKYFETNAPSGDGRCSDPACPCDDTLLPRGDGYLIVTPEVVQWRFDCPTRAEEKSKAAGMSEYANQALRGVPLIRQMPVAILACEQGALARGVDLGVARADAEHWWVSNEVPLRVTPMRDGSLMRMSDSSEKVLWLMQALHRRRREIEDPRRGRIFLSYSRFDFERVLEVDDWVRGHEYQTWFDIKHLDDRALWDQAIHAAIAGAHAVVACVSARSSARRGYVHYEWEQAVRLRGKRVIPLLLDDVSPPAALRDAAEPQRWFESSAHESLLERLVSLEVRAPEHVPEPVLPAITPEEYRTFKIGVLQAVRACSAKRARGDFDGAMEVLWGFREHPLFTLLRHEVRGIASTAAIVHAAMVEYLLAAIGSGSVSSPVVAELVRGVLEAPVWAASEIDPEFGLAEASLANRHYLHALTSAAGDTKLFGTPEALSAQGSVPVSEAPFVHELFCQRLAELEDAVGPHQPSFAWEFDIEPALAVVPQRLVDEARALIAEGTYNLVALPQEPNDPGATLGTWKLQDGRMRSFFAVIPGAEAWARALLVDSSLFFEDRRTLSALRRVQREDGQDVDSIGHGIGALVVRVLASAFEDDDETGHLRELIETLLSDDESLVELVDCLCTRIGSEPTTPRTAVLTAPPCFVIVTANRGSKEELRHALLPNTYERWMTLMQIQNPHLFKARQRGVQYRALFHLVLSIRGDYLDPGFAILDLPPLDVFFRSLRPSEMLSTVDDPSR